MNYFEFNAKRDAKAEPARNVRAQYEPRDRYALHRDAGSVKTAEGLAILRKLCA